MKRKIVTTQPEIVETASDELLTNESLTEEILDNLDKRTENLTKSLMITIDALKLGLERIDALEKKSGSREVTFQIVLGNGCAINYTCSAQDLDDVRKIAGELAEKMLSVYKDFLGEHAKAVQRAELQQHLSGGAHNEPEGYS